MAIAISRPPKAIGCQALASLPLDIMECGVIDVAALLLYATIEKVMSVSDMTNEPSVVASTPNPDALFAKELCDLLANVEVARPDLGRSIACLLTGMPL